ncbi:hypothetical protein EDC04DRAFT_2603897 [Pisolithus marmoratus]|nr:hypothetical protein EDC04DRAFT_2603897 [Pisolithus marmoratus]
MYLVFLKELKQQSASSFGQDDEKACNALQYNKQWMEMLYKGEQIHLNALCSMFLASAKAIITLWEQRVLWGINMCISYDALADDIGNHNMDKNTCFADHDSLAHKFFSNPFTSGHFGVKRNGRMIWDKAALQRWLADYAEFQEQLPLCCETLSGAPGHGMELTPLTLCNTRDYHKSAAITSLEKLILHMLDGLTSDLVIQSLAIAWPFAELASYIFYLHKSDVLQLYKTQLFVNHKHLFTSENISHSMAKLSLEHLSVKLTINPWQHLGQFAEELLQMDKNDTIDALQAGHSCATENHIYGLSPEALPSTAEDIIPLFLRASVQWQLIMHVIPGGLGLGYAYSSDPGQFQQLARAGKLGHDPQHEIPGEKENGTDIKISEEKIGDQVAAKLEKKVLGNLEALLTDRPVATIGPAIQTIVKDAVQEVMTSISTNLSANHGKRDAPPMNSADWDMMYVDPSPPATSEDDVQLALKEKGQANDHHNDQEAGPLEGVRQRNHGRNKLVRQEDQREAVLAVAQRKTDVVAMLRMRGGKPMFAMIPALLNPKKP